MRLSAHIDAGNGYYGATASIVQTEPDVSMEIIDKRSFMHLEKFECEGKAVTALDAAIAWSLQQGAAKVTVATTYTQGCFPHCRNARSMVFTNHQVSTKGDK